MGKHLYTTSLFDTVYSTDLQTQLFVIPYGVDGKTLGMTNMELSHKLISPFSIRVISMEVTTPIMFQLRIGSTVYFEYKTGVHCSIPISPLLIMRRQNFVVSAEREHGSDSLQRIGVVLLGESERDAH